MSFDWIEDSLCSRTKRPKPEEPYLWKNLLRTETDEKPEKKRMRMFRDLQAMIKLQTTRSLTTGTLTEDPWNSNKVMKYTGARKGNKSPPLRNCPPVHDSTQCIVLTCRH